MPHYYVTRSPDAWVEDMILGFPSYSLARQPDVGQLLLAPEVPDPRGWPVFGAYSAPFSDPAYYYLGDDSQVGLGTRVKRAIGNLLGLTLVEEKLANILGELLIAHARTDGTRWKPLRPTIGGFYEIWLGHKLWGMPAVAGGATITDNFTRANQVGLGTSAEGWSWSDIEGQLDIVSNKAQDTAASGVGSARADSDLASEDHYGECVCEYPADSARIHGPCVEFAAAATTYYQGDLGNDGVMAIAKVVTAARISLGTGTGTNPTAGQTFTVRLTKNGSTLTLDQDGVTKITLTNTAISGNVRCGISERTGTANRSIMSAFKAADLAAAALPAVGSWMSQGYGR